MYSINENYLKLQGSYLFADIAKKVAAYEKEHPDQKLIRLGIGDVTKPLVPSVIAALHKAVDEQARQETFRGYPPEGGFGFLKQAIISGDFEPLGISLSEEEILISDGAKSDVGNIREIFGADTTVAVCDPVYPVYVDSNVMAGVSSGFDAKSGRFKDILYLPCTRENRFVPELPVESSKEKAPGLIYICSPNNPTGCAMTKDDLQSFVDYANRVGSVIIFDAAYEAYITEENIPHSIYECTGAKTCAIEHRSFSKNAGFTGLRLSYTIVPKELTCKASSGKTVQLRDLWARRQTTKYNGAPYIVQRAAEAIYSPEGKKEVRENVAGYLRNASLILNGLKDMGFEAYGGVNSPYIWLRTPNNMTSWEFFDLLLQKAGIVGTPGVGFGSCGENYFRLTAFGTEENSREALERIAKLSIKK